VNKSILLVLLLVVLNSLVWITLIPIWHFPDEQAHFGQVAFIAEKGRNPQNDELDLTEEIYTSEQLLGTARDKFGNNKFTFHPEYRIEYTNSLMGKYEASIAALTKLDAKNIFIRLEASRYPPLYYIPASIIYKLFYAQDLFTRVFAVRFWSLLLFLANIYFIYKIGHLILGKNNLLVIALTCLVGFQPMMVFSNVGVNSDALGNFLFTIFLYLSLKIIIGGLKTRQLLFLILITVFCLYTKPQFIVTLPLLVLILLLKFCLFRSPDSPLESPLQDKPFGHIMDAAKHFVIIGGLITFFYLLYRLNIGPFSLISRFINILDFQSLIKFTWEYTLPHTYKEVMPWYWGIYDWLGVTYPRIVHRIINWVVLFSGVGFGVWIIKIIKERAFKEKKVQAIFFLIFSHLIFFLGISFYDWLSWYSQKYPLGVQGRYFFPLISSHMVILLLGWESLFPDKWSLKELGIKILGIFMVMLNFFALHTVARTYYDISTCQNFLWQASQYKPWFFKGAWLVILGFIYFMTIIVFLIEYIRYPYEKKSQRN